VRNTLKKHSTRPRLSVFRSHKHISAQVIDDRAGRTLAAASSLDKEVRASRSYGGNVAAAVEVGKLIARRALAAGVQQVTFDRREYRYHGRIAALADAARDAGLDIGAKPPAPEPEPAKPAKPPKKEKPAKKPPAAEAAQP
jgi:large subunit ribosomal protein L18